MPLQIDAYVKNTTSVPSFQMAYTDYVKDVDVSAQMEYNGVVEIGLTQMWFLALKDHCIQPDGKRALVLDVGANFGWYSIYAAKLGCRYSLCTPAYAACCLCCAHSKVLSYHNPVSEVISKMP